MPETATTPGLTYQAPAPIRIDIGCGKAKKPGFIGVDVRPFEGVDVTMDAGKDRWPWNDGTVDEINASHVVEHLKPAERIHFVNEAHRVLKPGAKLVLQTPHWASCRAYGDLTHEWPPVTSFWLFYLSKEWRAQNAPHNDAYTCDFAATWGYGLINDPWITLKNDEFKARAVQYYIEAAQDLTATLTKR